MVCSEGGAVACDIGAGRGLMSGGVIIRVPVKVDVSVGDRVS